MSVQKLPHGVTSYGSADEWAKATGGKYATGADGHIYAYPAPHGVLDRIAQFAPYGIAGLMGYGALSAAGVAGGAAAGGGAGAAGGTGVGATSSFWSPSLIGLLGTGINAATGLVGAHMQSTAADRGARDAAAANAAALAEMQREDALNRAQYLEERGRTWKLQDEREARLAPFRASGARSYNTLSSLLTLPNGYQNGPPVSGATSRRSLSGLL